MTELKIIKLVAILLLVSVITYSQTKSSVKLYKITPDLQRIIRPESLGAPPEKPMGSHQKISVFHRYR